MLKHCPRWGWLALFAACNLVCWSLVAVGVGLVAGQGVNFGIESRIRVVQATAAAVWGRLAESNRPGPSVTRLAQQPVQDGEYGGMAQATKLPSSSSQQITSTAEPGSIGTESTAIVAPADATLVPGPAAPAPSPTVVLISSPLSMQNPPLETLTGMGAEMDRSALGRSIEIEYGEATLNQEVQALLAENPGLPFQNVQVDLRPNLIEVTGYVAPLGFPVKATVEGMIEAADCRLQANVQSVTVAGFLSSGFITDYVKGRIQDAVNAYPSDSPFCVQQIVVEQDQATISGYRR